MTTSTAILRLADPLSRAAARAFIEARLADADVQLDRERPAPSPELISLTASAAARSARSPEAAYRLASLS